MRPFSPRERAAIKELHPGVSDDEITRFEALSAAALDASDRGDDGPMRELDRLQDERFPRLDEALTRAEAALTKDDEIA